MESRCRTPPELHRRANINSTLIIPWKKKGRQTSRLFFLNETSITLANKGKLTKEKRKEGKITPNFLINITETLSKILAHLVYVHPKKFIYHDLASQRFREGSTCIRPQILAIIFMD